MIKMGLNFGFSEIAGTAFVGYVGFGLSRSALFRADPLFKFPLTISIGYPHSLNFSLTLSKCFTTNSSFEQIVFTVMAWPYKIALNTCFG